MHSFLVSIPPDIKPSPDVLEIVPETSIGISEVRQIISFLSRKPFQSSQNAVIIHQAEKLTLPAQHAILKTLEEPPGNSQIYLVTNYPDALLPTILSRVQITMKQFSNLTISNESVSKSRELIEKLFSAKTVGERYQIMDSASFTRDSFSEFLDHLEYILHEQIHHSQLSTFNYQLIADTRNFLKSNVTLRLCLDYFTLNLGQFIF